MKTSGTAIILRLGLRLLVFRMLKPPWTGIIPYPLPRLRPHSKQDSTLLNIPGKYHG